MTSYMNGMYASSICTYSPASTIALYSSRSASAMPISAASSEP